MELHLLDRGQALLAAIVEGGDPLRDACPTDPLVHPEGSSHRPLMLVRMEAARRNAVGGVRLARQAVLLPRRIRLAVRKGRNDWPKQCPILLLFPDHAGAPRREHPFVGPRLVLAQQENWALLRPEIGKTHV